MKRHQLSILPWALTALLFALLSGISPVRAASTQNIQVSACNNGQIFPSPSPGTLDALHGIAAISAQDVWAVGGYVNSQVANNQEYDHALIEHWNGSQWSIVKSPNLEPALSYLEGVAAISSTDVWAVGTFSIDHVYLQTLIEHWNGKQWSVVKSPNGIAVSDALSGVVAISSTDVWAVGAAASKKNLNHIKTLIEHWNGTQWSIVPSPNPGAVGNGLAAVAANSSTDAWAVGYYAAVEFQSLTLVEHWNGTRWSVVRSPSVGRYPNEFRSVTIVSPTDIWAVGDYGAPPGNITLTLTEHWNGKQWSVISSPSPTSDSLLAGVVAFSTNNVWTVGSATGNGGGTLVEQWNGTNWSVVSSPNRPRAGNALLAVSADSASDIWAAGFDITNQIVYQTLIEHFCP